MEENYICELCGVSYKDGLIVFIGEELKPNSIRSISLLPDSYSNKEHECLFLCPRCMRAFIKIGKLLNPTKFENIFLVNQPFGGNKNE